MMRTALYEAHLSLGAKMVSFGGWEMPIHYKGIIHEHHVVREHVGIFDVSHMGRIVIQGKQAESFLNYLSTNNLIRKPVNTATYTVFCNASGMAIDDLIVYKQAEDRFFLIVNASNRQKDYDHLANASKGWDVEIAPSYIDGGILAVQGPKSVPLINSLFPETLSLKPMRLLSFSYQGEEIVISRTGYTGEEGFEICASNPCTVSLFHQLLQDGAKYQIEPIGLGARDTLRLEMGYALYGHELSDTIAPTESVSSWTVKWDKGDFLGKEALQAFESSSKKRVEYGIILTDKGIAREGCDVFFEGALIGKVTSGTFSPSLNLPIAIVLVERKLEDGDSVEVKIRHNLCCGKVVKLPFYHRGFKS